MENGKLAKLEERITNMSDEDICEILVDKEGWQEEAYEFALLEAKKRNIGLDSLQLKYEKMEELKIQVATEELSNAEKVLFMFSFVFIPNIVLLEKFRAEGYQRKLEQARFYKRIGAPVIGGVLFLAYMLFFFIRHLVEPSY